MTAGRVVGAIVAYLGVLVCVAAAVVALLPRPVMDRLHLLTPVTTIGAPLVGLGVAIANGWHLATGFALLAVVVVAATGPILAAATARAASQRDGTVAAQSPQ